MKNIVTFLILALVFSGCSTDDSANVPAGMLKKVRVQEFTGEQYVTRFYYNEHKLDRTESTNDQKQFYYYDGDLIVNIKTYDLTVLRREEQFTYDDSGRLTQYLNIDLSNDYRNKSTYMYNGDGTVTESAYSFYSGDPETLNYTRQFVFTGAEVSQEIITFTNGTVQTNTYTYDDKLVPEHDIVGFDKIRAFNPSVYKGIYHNIVNVTQSQSSTPTTESYSHAWEYNESGAPTHFSYGEGTIIIDAGNIQYFYR